MAAEPGPVDWARVDRRLCEAYHLTPQAIDRLTYSEIAVLCMAAGRGPAGGRNMGDEELMAEGRRWKALGPAERLEDARRRRDG